MYQDPGASLDPRWKVRRLLHEPLQIHTALSRAERQAQVDAMLREVGLPDAHLDLYPHELSGGQQRRVGLARTLMVRPSLVILDEPTSGLDVSVQASVLKLFRRLQAAFALTYLFISHDLAVVRAMCQRVAVMYLGKIVELAPAAILFEDPRHPYTRSLLSAVPVIGGRRVTRDFALEGEPPNPRDIPTGCRFRTRCPLVQDCVPRKSRRCAPPAGASWPATSRETARDRDVPAGRIYLVGCACGRSVDRFHHGSGPFGLAWYLPPG